MARLLAGRWDKPVIEALRPEIANCTRKQIKTVLGQIGWITSSTASACWRDFTAMVLEVNILHPNTYKTS